jgi:hypothetical protein
MESLMFPGLGRLDSWGQAGTGRNSPIGLYRHRKAGYTSRSDCRKS